MGWRRSACFFGTSSHNLIMGSLGFWDIQTVNQALLAKIARRLITTSECLLAKILLEKYCNKTSFLKVQLPSACSDGWRGIILGRDLLFNYLRGKAIGNGETISVWTDSWIFPKVFLKHFGPIFLQDKDLMVSNLWTRETKEWNTVRVENLLPELSSLILSIRHSVLGAQDFHMATTQIRRSFF